MNIIPEMEARALLSTAMRCDMQGDWALEKVSPGTYVIESGLVDQEGVGTRMMVKLYFRRGHKTGIVNYVFSVFKRTPHSLDRIYQLDVRQNNRPIKNLHDRSHVHIGALRVPGLDEWSRWEFEDVLDYFCTSTNITMSPGPVHPEHFELRS